MATEIDQNIAYLTALYNAGAEGLTGHQLANTVPQELRGNPRQANSVISDLWDDAVETTIVGGTHIVLAKGGLNSLRYLQNHQGQERSPLPDWMTLAA